MLAPLGEPVKRPYLSHIWSVAEQKFFWNYRWEPSSGLRGWETSAAQLSRSIIKGSFCWNWSDICNIKGLIDCMASSQEIRCVPVEEGAGLVLIPPVLEHLRRLWSLERWRRKTAAEQLSPLPCWWICSSRPQAFLITLVFNSPETSSRVHRAYSVKRVEKLQSGTD